MANELVLFPAIPRDNTLTFMWVSWAALVSFLYPLPFWSYILNDSSLVNGVEVSCNVPAPSLSCNNVYSASAQVDYAEAVKEWNTGGSFWSRKFPVNRKKNDKLYGCAAGQGIFGDWFCVGFQTDVSIYTAGYYSVSFFVSTASGTGLFGLVAFFPFLFFWIYGPLTCKGHPLLLEDPKSLDTSLPRPSCSCLWTRTVYAYTQLLFQVFFGLFQFFAVAYWPTLHTPVVTVFVFAEVAHFLTAAHLIGVGTAVGKILRALAFMSVFVLVLGLLTTTVPHWFGYYLASYGFWFSECTGLAMITFITPYVWTFDHRAKEVREMSDATYNMSPTSEPEYHRKSLCC